MILVLIAAALGGCNNPERWKFKEEVRLNNGSSIVVSRVALRNNVWPRLGNGGYQSVVNQWLTYPQFGIDWERRKFAGHEPFSIGIVNGKTYLAVTAGNSDLMSYCKEHPDGYRVYFWEKDVDGWRQASPSDELLDRLTYNLLADVSWGDTPATKPAMLTLKQKSERSRHDFGSTTTAREFLNKKYGARCIQVLPSMNTVPKASAPAAASAAARS